MDSFDIEVAKAREIVDEADLPADPLFEFTRSSGFLEIEGRRYPAGEVVAVTCVRRDDRNVILWQQVYRSNRYFSWLLAFVDDVHNGIIGGALGLVAA